MGITLKTELVIQELGAVLLVLRDYETCSHHQMMAAAARLRFCIATFKAKEADTVRLGKENDYE